ncbi:MAG TPA: response regulator, partial [Thermoanaerobacterales bacterium]|nr:response regulator [Thermoanaerobacterales bacterium]
MNDNFYIVDDDESIRRVLKKIIIDHNLGDVLGDAGEGLKAISEIKKYNPDIVLVDLLLPSIDGITLVSKLKEEGFGGVFIMISQVSSKDMISKAYKMGIEFYIHKPINVVEVISVIKNVKEK